MHVLHQSLADSFGTEKSKVYLTFIAKVRWERGYHGITLVGIVTLYSENLFASLHLLGASITSSQSLGPTRNKSSASKTTTSPSTFAPG